MLTIGTMPILLTIVSKLDLTPIMDAMKDIDIFNGAETKTDALSQLKGEKMATFIAELFAAVAPQLGKIAEDIPVLVAAYKDISVDEAKKLDLADTFAEIYADEGIRTFFTRALRRKAEQIA